MEKDFLISCQKEYSARKYFITGISLQSKDVGIHISYDTIHSAFIYTLEGEALIQFNNESFKADTNTIVRCRKSENRLLCSFGCTFCAFKYLLRS